MKTLVIFYSYTGHTKALAQELAVAESADILEIRDVARPGTIKAYTIGSFTSIRGKAWPIEPFDADMAAYDRLILMSPVWAGHTPPAVNALLARLPEGKAVSVTMVSGGGQSRFREKMDAALKSRGCTLEGFEDVKA